MSDGGAWRFIDAVTDFVFAADAPEKADVILIPGSRHIGHVLRAAALYRAGYAPLVLPSGKHGASQSQFIGVPADLKTDYPADYPTEWAFLRDVLRKNGVPDEAILREDEATFTWDNARKSASVLSERGMMVGTAILCCRPFHARRALLYYQTALPDAKILVCPGREEGVNRDDWFKSSEGRRRVLGEVRRLGDQIGLQFEDLCAATPDFPQTDPQKENAQWQED